METYSQMKKRHQEEFNALPKFAAFTEEQFEKAKRNSELKTTLRFIPWDMEYSSEKRINRCLTINSNANIKSAKQR